MNYQEQIRAFQQKRNEAVERQEALMKAAADEGRTLDDEESSEFDGIASEVKHIEAHIDRLRKLAGEGAEKAEQVKSKGPTIIVKSQDADEAFQGQAYTRYVIAKALAHMSDGEMSMAQIAEHRWGKKFPNFVQFLKAGVPGGESSTAAWAGRLVTADNRYMGDFVEFLKSKTIYDRLPLREIPANVTIKGQDGIATAYWVGESRAIAPSPQSFASVSLKPQKVAAISVISNELIRDSSPSAEALVRDGLVEACAQRVDQTFLSTTAASSGISPAGLLNGLTAENASGSTAEALRRDIYTLYSSFLTAKNASGLHMVMNPTLAKSISLMVNALGQTEFPGLTADGGTLLGDPVHTGDNVNAAHLILLKPSDIWKIGDMGIEVSLSRDATIEQDTAPTGRSDTPVAASASLVSMFQTESTAFKVVRPINYQKRRTGAVAYIGDADYGAPEVEVGGG
jgi:HK97 family phage major capsid protein